MFDEILEAIEQVIQVGDLLQGYCLAYSIGVQCVPESLYAHYGEDIERLREDYRTAITRHFQAWSVGMDWALENAPEAINPLMVQ